MSTPLHRALLGLLAAVISVLTFHQGMWALLHLASQMPPLIRQGVFRHLECR